MVGAIGLFALIVAAIVARIAINHTVYSPSKAVQQYLSALSRGDAAGALTRVDDLGLSTAERTLTNAVYRKASDRPADVELISADRHRDVAHVAVRYDQGGTEVTESFTVRRTGTRHGVFDKWVVDLPRIAGVSSGSLWNRDTAYWPRTVVVNGVDCPLAGDELLGLLPGTYTITAPDAGEYVRANTVTLTVEGNDGQRLDPDDKLGYRLTDLGRTAALRRAEEHLDACQKAAPAVPKGCPFEDRGLDEVTWAATEKLARGVWAAEGKIVVHLKGYVRLTGVQIIDYSDERVIQRRDTTDLLDSWTCFRLEGGKLVETELGEDLPD